MGETYRVIKEDGAFGAGGCLTVELTGRNRSDQGERGRLAKRLSKVLAREVASGLNDGLVREDESKKALTEWPERIFEKGD